MLSATFYPYSPFTGFISQIQGKGDLYIDYEAGSIFPNYADHLPEIAFKYELTETPAATDTKNG